MAKNVTNTMDQKFVTGLEALTQASTTVGGTGFGAGYAELTYRGLPILGEQKECTNKKFGHTFALEGDRKCLYCDEKNPEEPGITKIATEGPRGFEGITTSGYTTNLDNARRLSKLTGITK